MKKYVFYSHAGSGNHGCEAIVRCSTNILNHPLTLFSMNPQQDKKYNLQKIIDDIQIDKDIEQKKYSWDWIKARLETKFKGTIDQEIYNRKKMMLSQAKKGDVWFSIGGDNYCYPGTDILAAENSILHKKGAKTVLWGCSVEPSLLDDSAMIKDLSTYDLITARESITYDALSKINPNTVLVSDPAFSLPRIDLPLPQGWQENNMIGINASPLIVKNGKNSSIVMKAYKDLIREILLTTNYGIALIPHVVWKENDDRYVLNVLYNEFKDSGRIVCLDDHNCMELKGYIARCKMFIGARTHATIAAYSTCVPTLVLGYSVKSKGIAKDLFGTYKDYVIPVQKLTSSKELIDGFKWLQDNEQIIKYRLQEIMEDYSKHSYISPKILEKILL